MIIYGLAEEIDVGHGKDHEEGDDEEDYLAPLLELATEDDGVETALLEARGTILTVMVVMMMMIGHKLKVKR